MCVCGGGGVCWVLWWSGIHGRLGCGWSSTSSRVSLLAVVLCARPWPLLQAYVRAAEVDHGSFVSSYTKRVLYQLEPSSDSDGEI
jgi:hypothetical protein